MALWYRLLADAIVVVHAAYVAFVVLGFAAVLIGALLRWSWVRNLKFRLAHLGAIMLVVVEAIAGAMCPLTTMEARLRERAGDAPSAGDFIARSVHRLIFYDLPPRAFTVIYVAFAVIVIVTLILVPPRARSRTAK
ncbi:MAG TPA: DUF2784 domain-containing protein [Candidatus Acidoferrales bacterium]|nr:DUF2784 domain-containing protein [Candidatus Acidoferrales bacterium]